VSTFLRHGDNRLLIYTFGALVLNERHGELDIRHVAKGKEDKDEDEGYEDSRWQWKGVVCAYSPRSCSKLRLV
jgi:hypothetical protein